MANIRPRLRPRRVRFPLPISSLLPAVPASSPGSSRPDLTRTPEYLRTKELILRILQAQLDARNSSAPDPVVSAFPPGPLADAFGMIEEERRSGRPDEPPGPFFESIFVRGAIAWAGEKGFEEAAAVARREFSGAGAEELARALDARRGTPPLADVSPRAEAQ